MKQGRALPEVLKQLQQESSMKRDYIAPAQSFTLYPDGKTFGMRSGSRSAGSAEWHAGTETQFGTADLFHRQMGAALNIPAKYYDLMRLQKPDLLAENVNAWFADQEQNYMVRAMDYPL